MSVSTDKQGIVDFLIENEELSGWSEDDRADLESLGVGGLKRLAGVIEPLIENKGDEDDEEEEDVPPPRKAAMAKAKKGKKDYIKNADDLNADEADEDGQAKQRDTKGKAKKGTKGKITGLQSILQTNEEEEEDELTDNQDTQSSLEKYLEGAPTQIKELLTNGVAVVTQQRKQLVEMVFNHENNQFTKEYLSSLPMEALHGLASLVSNKKRRPNFVGAGGGVHVSPLQNSHNEEPLPLPTMNFSKTSS